jgi:hypothetical protein
VLKLSEGDLGRLHHFRDAALRDSRDVLYWAEASRDPSEPQTWEELRERLQLPPDAEGSPKP